MESQTQYKMNAESDVKVGNPRRPSHFLLRLLAIVTTLVAAIVTGVANETEIVPVSFLPNVPPLNVPATAKWQYSSAFVYFFVSNVIACVYGAFSLVLSLAKGTNGLAMTLLVLDLIMVALLFSGNGAAAAIGVVGYKGNSHVRWNKVCDVFGIYCRHIAASVAVSLVGSLAFMILIVLTTLNLRKKSP